MGRLVSILLLFVSIEMLQAADIKVKSTQCDVEILLDSAEIENVVHYVGTVSSVYEEYAVIQTPKVTFDVEVNENEKDMLKVGRVIHIYFFKDRNEVCLHWKR